MKRKKSEPKSLQEIAMAFKKKMQKIADESDTSISISVNGGEYHEIAKPQKKSEEK